MFLEGSVGGESRQSLPHIFLHKQERGIRNDSEDLVERTTGITIPVHTRLVSLVNAVSSATKPAVPPHHTPSTIKRKKTMPIIVTTEERTRKIDQSKFEAEANLQEYIYDNPTNPIIKDSSSPLIQTSTPPILSTVVDISNSAVLPLSIIKDGRRIIYQLWHLSASIEGV